jgi:hypothetical protein
LDSFRRETGIPVYFAIGNHDYLGAGNTPFPSDRRRLCEQEDPLKGSSNAPVSKYELIAMASRFNRSNPSSSPGWNYEDSFAGREEIVHEACFGESGAQKKRRYDQQTERFGCFLAARLSRAISGERYEILIADTSDYRDKGYLFGFPGKKYLGLTGWITTSAPTSAPLDLPTQPLWFQRRSDGTPHVRFIASHYPPDLLGKFSGRLRRIGWSGVLEKLGGMLLPEPAAGNYWLYAHNHAFQDLEEITVNVEDPGGEAAPLTIRSIGVGSTTDHGGSAAEEPHALVIEIEDGGSLKAEQVFPDVDCDWLDARLERLWRVPIEGEAFRPVRNDARGLSLIGLDRSYQAEDWDPVDRANALANLDEFIQSLEKEAGDAVPVELCLALRASRAEAGAP